MSQSEVALNVLLRGRLIFAACYTPVNEIYQIDFTTGEQVAKNDVYFLEGAVVSRSEISSFIKEQVDVSYNVTFFIVNKTSAEILTTSKLVIHGQPYSVKVVQDSFYSKWKVLTLQKSQGSTIFQPESEKLVCSDRVRVFNDWLVLKVKDFYSNTAIPEDLEVWTISGFTLADSLIKLWGDDAITPVGDWRYTELGRKSGYFLYVDGLLTEAKLAKNQVQTNKPELQPLLDKFNTFMGRL